MSLCILLDIFCEFNLSKANEQITISVNSPTSVASFLKKKIGLTFGWICGVCCTPCSRQSGHGQLQECAKRCPQGARARIIKH